MDLHTRGESEAGFDQVCPTYLGQAKSVRGPGFLLHGAAEPEWTLVQ